MAKFPLQAVDLDSRQHRGRDSHHRCAVYFISETLRRYTEQRMNNQLKEYTVHVSRAYFHPLAFSLDRRFADKNANGPTTGLYQGYIRRPLAGTPEDSPGLNLRSTIPSSTSI
jgi:hypothetical protein